MAIDIETKDCTQLGDAELAEMADLCADGPSKFEAGYLSKVAEAWVLITLARENGKLKGFSFCTLERVGGTPAVLIGLASIIRTTKRDQVLKGIMADQMRRAVMAFPDEDVLVGAQLWNAGGFEAFKALHDLIPRPDHKAVGEERAWGQRLAKRFGIDADDYDKRSFIVTGDGTFPACLDHESQKPDKIDAGVAALFDDLDHGRGDSLIGYGWAYAEDLEKLA